MNEDNVVDRLISELPDEDKVALAYEYDIIAANPSELHFIDRICADSRSIGLYHTSGLSTPSQVFMDMLSLSHLIDKDNHPYIAESKRLVNERYETLMDSLGLPVDDSRENAQYYTIVDVDKLIEQRYDADFAQWKRENITDIEFLEDLAKKEGVVLMYGPGFDAPQGCVRVSLANLNTDDYAELARRLDELLDYYHAMYEEQTALPAAA